MPAPQIICAGELLIDLISTEYAADFRSATTYERFAGGSPANLAANLARLGVSVGLVATVGNDAAGQLLIEASQTAGVDVSGIRKDEQPTTAILVTRSREVSDFEAYRAADAQILPAQFDGTIVSSSKIFHTTAFALSREPARSAILAAAKRVAGNGGRVSIDTNYAGKIWPDRTEALRVLADYIALGEGQSLVKASDVDYHRLFDETVTENASATKRLLDMGAGVVCLTLGEKGCYVSTGTESFALPTRPVHVKDTTGAGDAFWSGFLAAHLGGHEWEECARVGRSMAERKLVTVGPVMETCTVEKLLEMS